MIDIITQLKKGGIIAYPTEGVYGLGCDPFNETAVKRLCALKGRAVEKGLILIAADWAAVSYLTQPIPEARLAAVQATWPGAITWVFPASASVPPWISGAHASIALRLTDNPTAYALCQAMGGPLVSTSANRSHHPPALDMDTVKQYFNESLEGYVEGALGTRQGHQEGPTPLYEAITGRLLRS